MSLWASSLGVFCSTRRKERVLSNICALNAFAATLPVAVGVQPSILNTSFQGQYMYVFSITWQYRLLGPRASLSSNVCALQLEVLSLPVNEDKILHV